MTLRANTPQQACTRKRATEASIAYQQRNTRVDIYNVSLGNTRAMSAAAGVWCSFEAAAANYCVPNGSQHIELLKSDLDTGSDDGATATRRLISREPKPSSLWRISPAKFGLGEIK